MFARINLDPDEFSLYEKVFQQLTIDAPRPDLVIYLQASPDRLLERILTRGVSSERRIDREYLEQINEVYSEFSCRDNPADAVQKTHSTVHKVAEILDEFVVVSRLQVAPGELCVVGLWTHG